MTQIAGYFNMGYLVNYKRWQALNEAIIFDKEKGGKFSHLLDIGISIVKSLVKDHGFSPIVASAIAGNMFAESKFDPTKVSDKNYYGLMQWDPKIRKPKLFKLPNPTTIQTQLSFIKKELNEPYYLKFLNLANASKTVEEATDIITRGYEGAAKSETRRSAAKELFDLYQMNSENQPQLTANIDPSLQDLPVD